MPVSPPAVLPSSPAAPASIGGPDTSSGQRKDIQALRAVAIGAVVINHLWPGRLPGGYIGVDVFFVVSGFLITSHLLREIRSTGTVRLGRFYARRARRLLPAALIVLTVSAAGTLALLPYGRWGRNAAEVAASAFYAENWFLAARSENYSAMTDAATVARHYWSLAVEEQFYLVWPLVLLLVVAALGRRHHTRRGWAPLAWVISAVGGASLVTSVLWTTQSPASAYYATPVRIWEFAVGALVAIAAVTIPGKLVRRRFLADLLAFTGAASILGSAIAMGPDTPFPGWTALIPVVGTAAVIMSGTGWDDSLLHARVTSWRPIQLVGDVSYSLYLWHWPLLVLAPFALGRTPDLPDRVVLALVALGLAILTKRFVEDPGRTWRWAAARHHRTFALVAAGTVIVGATAGGLSIAGDAQASRVAQRVASIPADCRGPLALGAGGQCAHPFDPAVDPVMTEARNNYWTLPPEHCRTLDLLPADTTKTTARCDFSDGDTHAPHVWLVGDSHAQHWVPPVAALAEERGWVLTTSFLGGCPAAEVHLVTNDGIPQTAARIDLCHDWRRRMRTAVVDAGADLVLTSAYSRGEGVDDGSGRSQLDQYVTGYASFWATWIDAQIPVVALGDSPLNGPVRDTDCVVLHPTAPLTCAVDRAVAHPVDPLVVAAQNTDGVTAFDPTDGFCDDRRCYAVVGGVPVYYDFNHLNREYSVLFAQRIGDVVDQAMTAQ